VSRGAARHGTALPLQRSNWNFPHALHCTAVTHCAVPDPVFVKETTGATENAGVENAIQSKLQEKAGVSRMEC